MIGEKFQDDYANLIKVEILVDFYNLQISLVIFHLLQLYPWAWVRKYSQKVQS